MGGGGLMYRQHLMLVIIVTVNYTVNENKYVQMNSVYL
jgi:hypothetical protein